MSGREKFDEAWAKRPWITEDESDKDRAWRWWQAGFEAAVAQRAAEDLEDETYPARAAKAMQILRDRGEA
jgi:hypothetical protein